MKLLETERHCSDGMLKGTSVEEWAIEAEKCILEYLTTKLQCVLSAHRFVCFILSTYNSISERRWLVVYE